MGFDTRGNARFRRRDVDIITNETTMSRSGISTAVVTAQPAGNGAVITAVGSTPPVASVGTLSPDTIEFSQDVRTSDAITIGGHTVRVLEATPAYVRFRLE